MDKTHLVSLVSMWQENLHVGVPQQATAGSQLKHIHYNSPPIVLEMVTNVAASTKGLAYGGPYIATDVDQVLCIVCK